jgi:hypothetical protein
LQIAQSPWAYIQSALRAVLLLRVRFMMLHPH